MRTKRFYISGLIGLICISLFAVAPTGYYSSLEGKKAAVLKTELHKIICQDTTHYLGYGSGAGNTWQGFYYTDRNLSTNLVIDMYSDSLRYFPTDYISQGYPGFGQKIHIEHSVPKSWWGCDITHPDCPARDLNHLFPADGSTNEAKNDNPLGVVTGTPTTNNGESKVGPGGYDGFVGTVFEPADKYKGDFARAYFYMATAYEHYVNKWDLTKPENMMQNNKYPVLKPGAVALLLQWHRKDPVSVKEFDRNDAVFGIQKNRNPFVDYPQLVEYIWGNLTTVPYRLDGSIVFPYLNYPNDNDTINLGNTYYQQAKDTTISLKAMNLTGNLTLSIGGTNVSSFSLNKTTITKAEAEVGTTIKIHFLTSTIGNLSALLTISGGGITTMNLRLKTNTTDEFAALAASNTTNSGFTAVWTPSSGATSYSLNVYSIENTGTTPTTLIEEDFLLALPNTWTKDGYVINTTGTEKLGTADLYGKLTLPALNLSTATATLTVRAKQYGTDNGAPLIAALDGQTLTTWTTAVANKDFTVNLPVSTAASSISIYTVAGKRVYVDYVKLVSNVPVYSQVSVSGYPKSVGNVFSYTVTGLFSNHNYYYTITPIGNGGSVSNQISVQTSVNTGVNLPNNSSLKFSVSTEGILLQNVSEGSEIFVLDATGKKIFSTRSSSPEVQLPITRKGMYLLQVQQKSVQTTYKILR
ncbi:MAG: endonuclease [Paludibacter sp.]